MLIKREDLHNRLLLLAGIGRLNLVTKALDDAGKRISRYLIMNFLVNAGYGIVLRRWVSSRSASRTRRSGG